MDLSVVIPTMNKSGLLRRTLTALAAQDAGPGRVWEVVVVDDGSTDDTAAVLAELQGSFPRPLVAVSPGRNVGRARARNLGARSASGRCLLFLDDDILCPEGLLAAHLDLLDSEPGTGAIGYAVTDPQLIDAPHFHYLDSRGVARLGPGPAPARFFVTQNAAVPREAFLAVGGFDEGFSAYGFEDMEVAFRLEDLQGIRFKALTHPVPLHIHHHSLEDYLEKKVECGRHSLPRLAELHPGRLREMKVHLVVGPATGGERLFRGLLGVIPAGLLRWLVRSWPCGPGCRPRLGGLYASVMNLTVLSCFLQGVRERS